MSIHQSKSKVRTGDVQRTRAEQSVSSTVNKSQNTTGRNARARKELPPRTQIILADEPGAIQEAMFADEPTAIQVKHIADWQSAYQAEHIADEPSASQAAMRARRPRSKRNTADEPSASHVAMRTGTAAFQVKHIADEPSASQAEHAAGNTPSPTRSQQHAVSVTSLPPYKAAYFNEDNTSGAHIVYSVLDPQTGKFRRYRVKLNKYRRSYPTPQQMRKFAEGLVRQINIQLAGGWSPIGERHSAREFTPIEEVAEKYLRDKQSEVRHATMRSYKSGIDIFLRWCRAVIPGCSIIDFNRIHALRFMEYLLADRHVSNRTYNCHLKRMRVFMQWAVSHCYCKENAFSLIKMRHKEPKQRTIIPAQTRKQIFDYILQDGAPMSDIDTERIALFCYLQMVYVSLMRPAEIERCRICQLNFEEHYVHIPAEQAKCRLSRNAPLSDELIIYIKEYLSRCKHKDDDLLFGAMLHPGKRPLCTNYIKLRWDKIRENLQLPKEMQVYSFRDTRIVDLLHAGVDDLTVMHAAGHHDLSITSVYADHVDHTMIERVRNA